MRLKLLMALALMAAGESVFAQTNQNVPAADAYPAFSRFVADRNIFDPNRQPHYTATTRPRTRTRTPRSSSAPAFTFVGTMSYTKGLFAFFNGNNADLKKALVVSEKIAGYTVTEISHDRVALESADHKEKLELKIGDVMRQENGKWDMTGPGELPAGTSSTEPTASGSASPAPAAENSGTPASALEANDILKKLMQQREKENQ